MYEVRATNGDGSIKETRRVDLTQNMIEHPEFSRVGMFLK